MLIELVNTLVTALGQKAANVTLVIFPGILLANAEGEEVQPPEKGRDATTSEAQTNTSARRRRARRRRCSATRNARKSRNYPEVTWDQAYKGLYIQ